MKLYFVIFILGFQLVTNTLHSQERKIDYYKVQEIIKDRFGGSKTTYSVSDLSMVSTVDLGPTNQRIITPVYVKTRIKSERFATIKARREALVKLQDSLRQRRNRALASQDSGGRARQNRDTEESENVSNQKDTPLKTSPVELLHEAKMKVSMPYEPIDRNIAVNSPNTKVEDIKIKTAQIVSSPKNSIKVESTTDKAPIASYTFLNKNNEIIEDTETDEALLAQEIEHFKKNAPFEAASQDPNRIKPQFAYIRIYDTYERVAEKGYKSIVLYTKLSDYFYFGNQMTKAVKWYEKLFDATKKLDTVYYYRYALALQKTGKKKKGDEMMNAYVQLTN